MRISNIIRAVENIVINTGGAVIDASKTLYTEVEQEARARALYNAETSADRRSRLIELREAVIAVDALHTAHRLAELAAAQKTARQVPRTASGRFA